MERAELLTELNSHVVRAQRLLAEYLPEDSGKTEKDNLAELLGILDSRELHAIQKRIRRKPALFNA